MKWIAYSDRGHSHENFAYNERGYPMFTWKLMRDLRFELFNGICTMIIIRTDSRGVAVCEQYLKLEKECSTPVALEQDKYSTFLSA